MAASEPGKGRFIMHRETLNDYIGQTVTVTFFDGTGAFGKLCFSDELCEKNHWVPKGYYYIPGERGNLYFRASHVKKLRIF